MGKYDGRQWLHVITWVACWRHDYIQCSHWFVCRAESRLQKLSTQHCFIV